MSTPMTASFPGFQSPNPDFLNHRDSKSSVSSAFPDNLSGAGGFVRENMDSGASSFSGRVKPRLTKMRKKQLGAAKSGKSVRSTSDDSSQVNEATRSNVTDSNPTGFNDLRKGSTNFGNYVGLVFGGNNDINVGRSAGTENGDTTETRRVSGKSCNNGVVFGSDRTNSISNPGLQNGNSFSGANMDSSMSNVSFNSEYFVFGSNCDKDGSTFNLFTDKMRCAFDADKSGSTLHTHVGGDNSDLGFNATFTGKESGLNGGLAEGDKLKKSDNFGFAFGDDKYDSENMKQESKNTDMQSDATAFLKVDGTSFTFRASKSGSAANSLDLKKQDYSSNAQKNESSKAQSDAKEDSERFGHSSVGFPFNPSFSSTKVHDCFVFGAESNNFNSAKVMENNSNGRNGGRGHFTGRDKDNTDDGLVNGGIRSKNSLNPGGTTLPVDEMNYTDSGKTEDLNTSHNCNAGGGYISNFIFGKMPGLGTDFQRSPLFDLSDEMKGLKIDGSEEVAQKSRKCSSNSSSAASDVFVFRSNLRESAFSTERTDTTSKNSFRNANAEGNDLDKGEDIDAKRDPQDANMPKNEAEKGKTSFTSTPIKLESSFTDFISSDMKFSFSISDLFPGVNKKLEFSANCKSARRRRLKKANVKLRQRSSVQHMSKQAQVPKGGGLQENHDSPGCGSPMDFSPFQNACSNDASSAGFASVATGVEGEDINVNGKDFVGNTEKLSDDGCKFSFSASLPGQDGLSAIRNQYKKKYKLKVGPNRRGQSRKSSIASSCSSVQPSPFAHNTSDEGPGHVKSRATPSCQRGEKFASDADKENSKQGPVEASSDELCEHWRIRGNQAYHAGKLSKAEEFYSMGINSVSNASIQLGSIKSLLLCYSNRAATRMSLGRMREALQDCTKGIELDPSFLKATVRAGNCHLSLGEVEDAMRCYQKCLESRIDVCLDRRITIEAADGLHKSQKVADYMHQAAKLLEERTHDAATSALENIAEALMISHHCDRLLEIKGEALCNLQKYEEVIQLCEQTLDISEKNLASGNLDDSDWESSHVRLWRWRLQSKSHYHLGKLDTALDLIGKQEELISTGTKYKNMNQELLIPFAATVRELLTLKKLGNGAFQSGKHSEAVEHYTAAISKSGESGNFMAICFCNRAAAYQALGQIVDAIADCNVAIALNENYQKAVSRRATLYETIRDYKQAVCDLQRLVSLLECPLEAKTQESGGQDKSNCGSMKDLRRTRRRLSLIEEKAKTETSLDLYLILGIKASDAEAEIKRAYRKAALRHHPDKAGQLLARTDGGDDGRLWKEVGEKIHKDADRLFKIIGEAYAVLSDTLKRSKYNDDEKVRNYYRDSTCESPSTSYSSAYEKGSRYGRQSGFYSSSSERSYSRRNFNASWRSYSSSQSRW